MIYTDVINLEFGSSLILSHRPEKLSYSDIYKKLELNPSISIEKYGLFDTAAPNFQTFFPDVTAEDLVPNEGDLIKPLFRALSKTVVHPNMNPIDFGKGNVLKDAMNLLVGQAIFANHEANVGNELGVVTKVSFQNKTTINGVEVPAGINAELQIDGKAHPTIARGIMMDPPSIHSTSVTVQFQWEQSHKSLDREEFFAKLGSAGEDGKLVRRIVTEITRFHEISLVSHGADPFAQKIGSDGNIINPVFARDAVNLSAEQKEKQQVYYFDYKTDLVNLSDNVTIPVISNNNNTHKKENMEHLIAKLKSLKESGLLKLEEGIEITAENALEIVANSFNSVTELTNTIATRDNSITELTTERDAAKTTLTEKETKITELNKSITEFKPNATIGEEALEATRNEVIRLHGILNPDGDEAMLEVIKAADFSALKSFNKQYAKQAEEKFTGTCDDCGSHKVSRMSAATPAEGIVQSNDDGAGDPADTTKNQKVVSNDDVAQDLKSLSQGSATQVHGKEIKEETK